jgi:hypothetical protein
MRGKEKVLSDRPIDGPIAERSTCTASLDCLKDFGHALINP